MICRKLPPDRIHLFVPTKLPRPRDSITIFLEVKEVRCGLFLHGPPTTSSRIRNQEQYHEHVGSLEKSSSFRSIWRSGLRDGEVNDGKMLILSSSSLISSQQYYYLPLAWVLRYHEPWILHYSRTVGLSLGSFLSPDELSYAGRNWAETVVNAVWLRSSR
jgi:hypothetical protein